MGNAEYMGSPWERRHHSAFEGLRIPFGAAVRFKPPKSLAKRLPKFGPNAVPGIFLGWHIHPGGRWKGEYLVAYWPDFQELGIEAKRIAVHTVQEVILDELPVSDADAPKLVGGWRFPLAQVLDEATWSLSPSAQRNIDVVSPSADPEQAEEEGVVAPDEVSPWVDDTAPQGAVPPSDQKPLLDFPFT